MIPFSCKIRLPVEKTALTAASPLYLLDKIVGFGSRLGVSASFLRFAIVGTLGFLCDTATVYLLHPIVNLYVAGTVSFVVAASFNWFLNRIWTFRGIDHAPLHLQWAKFLIANSIGFVANRGAFFFLVASSGVVVAYPIIGVAAGSLAGLVFNYFLSKTFVFR